MLIFATANTFLQLNLVFVAKSRTGFRSVILWKHELKVRSSHWSWSVKIGVPKYFANFTGKHLCWSLFLTEFPGLQLFKKVSPTQVFSCGICENFKNTYFEENLWTTTSETCSNFTRAALFWYFTLLAQIGTYTLILYHNLQFCLPILPLLPLILL